MRASCALVPIRPSLRAPAGGVDEDDRTPITAGWLSELPTATYRRVMVRLIIPTDRRDEIGKQIAAGSVALPAEGLAMTAHKDLPRWGQRLFRWKHQSRAEGLR